MIQKKNKIMVPITENPTKEEELSEDSNLHICMWKGIPTPRKTIRE